MTFLSDIDAGREKYRRRNERRNLAYSRRSDRATKNGILIEVGSFLEFAVSKFRRGKADLPKPSTEGQSRQASPCFQIMRGDINSFFAWVCSYLPQEKKGYDALGAAWERGRRG